MAFLLGFLLIGMGLIIMIVAFTCIHNTVNNNLRDDCLALSLVMICVGIIPAVVFSNPISTNGYEYFVERKAYLETHVPETNNEKIAMISEAVSLNKWLKDSKDMIMFNQHLYFGIPDGFMEEQDVQLEEIQL